MEDVHLHIIELYLPPLHIFCQLKRFCDIAVMNKVRYFCFVLHIPFVFISMKNI